MEPSDYRHILAVGGTGSSTRSPAPVGWRLRQKKKFFENSSRSVRESGNLSRNSCLSRTAPLRNPTNGQSKIHEQLNLPNLFSNAPVLRAGHTDVILSITIRSWSAA